MRQNRPDRNLILIFAACQIALSFGTQLFGFFLQLGLLNFALKVARGENAQISDLFSGGRFFLRGLGVYILFTMMVLAGMLLCIIPGFIVTLMFSPCLFVLVDQDVGVIESLRLAKSITTNNLLALFILVLAAIGLSFAGLMTLCIGLLFVIPYLILLQAVVYLRMSGQPVARPS